MWELMKPSGCPHPNAGLIWYMTADNVLDLDDDASLHDLARIHHLLALKVTKQNGRLSTEPSEGSSSSNWLRQGTCLASSCGGWREALENEMNLIESEAYHRPTGSKYLVGSTLRTWW